MSTDNSRVSADRGFLVVSQADGATGRVPLDDIAAVILHAHGVIWTARVATELAKRSAPLVICDVNHAPVAVLLALEGHHAQGARIRDQWSASRPLSKQLWKRIVSAKITTQAGLLAALGRREVAPLLELARRVRSGDPENLEAQAARKYWPALMGPDFRRDRSEGGANSLLNYGYTVLRACVARSIVAAGLNPSIGLHHENRGNAFALADDLIEPFRPLVDATVLGLIEAGVSEVTPDAKRRLASIIALDLRLDGEVTPLTVAIRRLAHSLVISFRDRRANLAIFDAPDRNSWSRWVGRVPGEVADVERISADVDVRDV
ncbi:type II CRISPR-associated endonuclease Cas1 [Phenylobacterium sp.]|uniref:type II CRISPR-associated endonuclease Cas1 n=1 Tax=Phenylobacterium sp. TaxID=1871053 RepID=UPI0025D45615|nr:type II CRISPR-associated endonuclease Cas1 [Phenylobacterium sp.]